MCSNHYYWWIPFSAVNWPFFNHFTCMPAICSWGTNCTSFATTTIQGFITIFVRNWGPFQGVNSRSGSSSRSILGLYFWSEFRVYSSSSSGSIYVSLYWYCVEQTLNWYVFLITVIGQFHFLLWPPNHCYWSIPFSAVTSPASSSIFVFYFLTWI